MRRIGQNNLRYYTSAMRTIIEHKGLIEVESELGEGTLFRLFLPNVEDSSQKEEESEKLIYGSANILFVDDELANRTTAKDILSNLGYTVYLAENGKEATDLFRRNKNDIDLIILDLIMPVMNGEEAFFKLREIDPNCRIIIISGNVGDTNINELIDKGLCGFLNKPYRIHEMSKMIDKVMNL